MYWIEWTIEAILRIFTMEFFNNSNVIHPITDVNRYFRVPILYPIDFEFHSYYANQSLFDVRKIFYSIYKLLLRI
ncbi:hypothetical protein APS47_00430 [Leptospira kirschneri serovar Mozdok]|nr:hypothetical protein APS47_00430 [Leptospira kirschneri serovar Mozdok]